MKTNLELFAILSVSSFSGRVSAWDKGVHAYALDLLESLINNGYGDKVYNTGDALSGASNWGDFSRGGCSLIYDCDIAERLCTPSELKRTKGGERNPNSREDWIDVQTRALFQADRKLCRLSK